MASRVQTAVIPAAGIGTRFLPASRSVPKVMLPVFDTPALHYAVDEAARAGIEHVVIIVSERQQAIGDYFSRDPELERALETKGDFGLLDRVRAITDMAEISYVRQDRPLGLGHAVLTARDLVGGEPFAVILPDDIIWDETPTIGRMLRVFTDYGGSVLAVKEVPDKAVPSLGIVETRPVDGTVEELLSLVEKPSIAEAPSNLAIIGRYVLTPLVFEMLERTEPGAGGEIQFTDAIARLLSTQKGYAYRFPGTHFDTGTPLGLLKASVYAALKCDTVSPELRRWIGILGELQERDTTMREE